MLAKSLLSSAPERGLHSRTSSCMGDHVQLSKPVIAAANGDVFAGGWMLTQMLRRHLNQVLPLFAQKRGASERA